MLIIKSNKKFNFITQRSARIIGINWEVLCICIFVNWNIDKKIRGYSGLGIWKNLILFFHISIVWLFKNIFSKYFFKICIVTSPPARSVGANDFNNIRPEVPNMNNYFFFYYFQLYIKPITNYPKEEHAANVLKFERAAEDEVEINCPFSIVVLLNCISSVPNVRDRSSFYIRRNGAFFHWIEYSLVNGR